MKNILLVLLTLVSLNVFGQSEFFKVKEGSFHKIDGCVTIPAHTDQNDLPMGVIKIIPENITEQQRTKLQFEGNLATGIEVEQKVGETWVYVTARAVTFLRIKHPDFGVTEFNVPMEIEANQCYEMVLQYIPLTQTTETEHVKPTYLIISSDHSNAVIYIDDKQVGIKEASRRFNIGTTHTWRIECNMYHTESGTVTLNDRVEISKTLRPAFGYVQVSTLPEEGAMVYVDDEYVGNSPIKTGKLKSGTHTVRVVKDMYQITEEKVVVKDGQTTISKINMSANYVDVTIIAEAETNIYVDEEYKGKGKWSGRLSDGSHYVEAIKEHHKPNVKNIELVLGKPVTITLDAPAPIYGSVDINSEPILADIYIDGKHYGQTPNYIDDIIIGTHTLKIEKKDYTTITKIINIEEGKTLTLNETLQNETESAEKQYELGIEYYNKQEYAKAVEHTLKAAELEHADAQFGLGFCYYNGIGVAQDFSEAVKWFRKAAEQGLPEAQLNLGLCYYDGTGVTQRYSEAVKWFRKAAEQGDADAQSWLGYLYYTGEGITQNYKEAVRWFHKAAEQGDVISQHGLGLCYYNGEGVTQDYTEAAEWFRKAAEQEYADAQGWLGFCYENGEGVPKDLTKAKEWYQKAANNGSEDAKQALKDLENTAINNTQQTYYNNTQKKSGTVYGREYVDLGLSVKWATCNIGANKPEDYGYYYAWGETKTKSTYDFNNCYSCGIEHNDIAGVSAYDAATANWFGSWRLPTKDEAEELKNRCTWTWINQNGVDGYKVTGPNGNSIFLPAGGFCIGTSFYKYGEVGHYWTSTPGESNEAFYIYFNNNIKSVNCQAFHPGRSIRPVTE